MAEEDRVGQGGDEVDEEPGAQVGGGDDIQREDRYAAFFEAEEELHARVEEEVGVGGGNEGVELRGGGGWAQELRGGEGSGGGRGKGSG